MTILTRQTIENNHDKIISIFDGLNGWRDKNQLSAAIYSLSYCNTIEDYAGALLYYIAEGHIWNDGNKRTAVVSVDIFLNTNSAELNVDTDTYETFILQVAKKEKTKEQCVQFIKTYIKPI